MKKLAIVLACSLLSACATTQTKSYDMQLTCQHDGAAMMPRPIVSFSPRYPKKAYDEGIHGWVKMAAKINTDGKVDSVKVLDSSPKGVFEKNAKSAFEKWLYVPMKIDGKPVRFRCEYTMKFNKND
ncbi:energy transducer TonB [Gallaecimonas sp. GXIMD1310]|uniref:energy transducer TonB n=1 Tax=Gallaecimonas sp. GXIMD1310 TaxID=3131926 RepID=UPI003254842E